MDICASGQPDIIPALDYEKLLWQYCDAEKRLLIFDYDGTLTPLVRDPEQATLPTQTLHSVEALSTDSRNTIWIVSGRDQGFLEKRVGHIRELGLSAEHGCFIRKPRSDSWESLIEQIDLTWQTEVIEAFQRFTARTKGSFTEQKRVAVTWHYQQADLEVGASQAQECLNYLEETVVGKWNVVIMSGKANVEVRPACTNKGSVVMGLVHENLSAAGRQYENVLCVGDDHADEGMCFHFGSTTPLVFFTDAVSDMFRALQKSNIPTERICTITVGPPSKCSAAKWSIPSPAGVIKLIARLNSTQDG